MRKDSTIKASVPEVRTTTDLKLLLKEKPIRTTYREKGNQFLYATDLGRWLICSLFRDNSTWNSEWLLLFNYNKPQIGQIPNISDIILTTVCSKKPFTSTQYKRMINHQWPLFKLYSDSQYERKDNKLRNTQTLVLTPSNLASLQARMNQISPGSWLRESRCEIHWFYLQARLTRERYDQR